MSRSEPRHASRLVTWVPLVVVATLLGAAFTAFEYDLGERLGIAAEVSQEPAEVPAPAELNLPPVVAPEPLAEPAPVDGVVDADAVRRAVNRVVRRKALGKHVVAAVGSPSGQRWWENGGTVATPASLTKLVTGLAALESLGPDHRFSTEVVRGSARREVILVGGGDPYLAGEPARSGTWPAQADLTTLAQQAAAALVADGVTRVRVRFDDSLFSGPALSPHWPDTYFPEGVVAPITALWVDQGDRASGWGHEERPAEVAARLFAQQLRAAGVDVVGTPKRTRAPADVAALATVHSAPVSQIVEQVIAVSDNEGAEVLAHQVGVAEGTGGSFAGASDGVRAVLGRLGIDLAGIELYDGSGLSRENLLSAEVLLEVLERSAEGPELRAVVDGLPVAGFNGSLTNRLSQSDPDGLGRVRAKTGTLTGVHGFAGTVTDRNGTPMTFVILADQVKVEQTLAARKAIDDFSAALAACRCSAAPSTR